MKVRYFIAALLLLLLPTTTFAIREVGKMDTIVSVDIDSGDIFLESSGYYRLDEKLMVTHADHFALDRSILTPEMRVYFQTNHNGEIIKILIDSPLIDTWFES